VIEPVEIRHGYVLWAQYVEEVVLSFEVVEVPLVILSFKVVEVTLVIRAQHEIPGMDGIDSTNSYHLLPVRFLYFHSIPPSSKNCVDDLRTTLCQTSTATRPTVHRRIW